MVNGVPGRRSTYGDCFGVLSWQIVQGHSRDVTLDGLAVALVYTYDDDEPGSPWSMVLDLDERADDQQRKALEDIFLGRIGGPHVLKLPWVRKPSDLLDVRVGRIEVADGELRVGEVVRLGGARPFETADDVRCVVPGYERTGAELVAAELFARDEPFTWQLAGNCAYMSDFDYASEVT